MKICMVTGGSGGHIYPALTFAEYVKSRTTHDVFFIGNEDRMESRIVPEAGYQFFAIHNKGLQGSVVDKLKAVAGQFKAINEAKALLKREKPDIVFAFGGYVTLPVVIAASRLKIKVVLHEQNAFVGKANKMAARHASAIITCYEDAFKGYKNVYLFGNPRGAIDASQVDPTDVLTYLNLNEGTPIVLYVMGSQGARTMNAIAKSMIADMQDKPFSLVISTGNNEYERFMEGLDKLPENVRVEPFVDQKALLKATTLVVARSGATTIAELAAFNVPSILVPSPYVANNHQYYNAKALEDKGACILLPETSVTKDALLENIEALLSDKTKLKAIGTAVSTFSSPNTNENILMILESLVNDHESA